MSNGGNMKAEKGIYTQTEYTHAEYRAAEVARILNEEKKFEYYYRGKLITKEKADMIVYESQKRKGQE